MDALVIAEIPIENDCGHSRLWLQNFLSPQASCSSILQFSVDNYRIVGCSSRRAQLPTNCNLWLPQWPYKWDELFECDLQPKASGPNCKKKHSQRHPVVIPNDLWTGCRYQARNPELSRYTKPYFWNLHASPLEISCFLRFWEPAMGKPSQSAEIHVQNPLQICYFEDFWDFEGFWYRPKNQFSEKFKNTNRFYS